MSVRSWLRGKRLRTGAGAGSARAIRLLHVAAVVAVVVGLVGVGTTAGKWWADRDDRRALPKLEIKIDSRAAVDDNAPGERVMPSLAGLTQQEALAALAGVGLASRDVGTQAVPAAGATGVVVGQDPGPGTTIDGDVTLLISKEAAVPRLVGKTETQARTALGELGARVTVEQRYQPGKAEGVVLATKPRSGAALADSVVLTVAQAPSSVFLGEIEAVKNDCGDDRVSINGHSYDSAILCQISDFQPSIAEYALNRRVVTLSATLGQSDTADPNYVVRIRVIGDRNAVLSDQSVRFGTTAPMSVNVLGQLRVRIELSIANPGPECCGDGVVGAMANARFSGAPADIDALVDTSSS